HAIIVSKAFAVSPAFSQQVMTDNHNDWIDWSKKHPFEKDSSTDITRVTYFSDGKTLNATLWLGCTPRFPWDNSREISNDAVSGCNQRNVIVSVENVSSQTTLKEYTNISIKDLNPYWNPIAIHSSENTSLAGYPAHKIEYDTT